MKKMKYQTCCLPAEPKLKQQFILLVTPHRWILLSGAFCLDTIDVFVVTGLQTAALPWSTSMAFHLHACAESQPFHIHTHACENSEGVPSGVFYSITSSSCTAWACVVLQRALRVYISYYVTVLLVLLPCVISQMSVAVSVCAHMIFHRTKAFILQLDLDQL